MTDVLDALGGHQAVFDAIKAATQPCSDGTCVVSGVMISVQDFVAALPEDARRRIAAEARQHGDGGREADILIVALGEAAFTFETYSKLHSAKGTSEGHEKAAKNTRMAERCRAAIAEYRASPALPDTTGRELLAAELEAERRPSAAKRVRDGLMDKEGDFAPALRAIERALSFSRQRVDDRMRAVSAVVTKWERGENHNAGAFDADCETCLILADLRAALEGADHG